MFVTSRLYELQISINDIGSRRFLSPAPFIRRYIFRCSSFFSSLRSRRLHREKLCRTRESFIPVCLPAMAIKGSIVLAVRELRRSRKIVMRFHEIGRVQSREGIPAFPCCIGHHMYTLCINKRPASGWPPTEIERSFSLRIYDVRPVFRNVSRP